MFSLGQNLPVEVVPRELYLGLKGRDGLCIFADAHNNLNGAGVAESEKLLESDGMDVLWFVESDEEKESEFRERP